VLNGTLLSLLVSGGLGHVLFLLHGCACLLSLVLGHLEASVDGDIFVVLVQLLDLSDLFSQCVHVISSSEFEHVLFDLFLKTFKLGLIITVRTQI